MTNRTTWMNFSFFVLYTNHISVNSGDKENKIRNALINILQISVIADNYHNSIFWKNFTKTNQTDAPYCVLIYFLNVQKKVILHEYIYLKIWFFSNSFPKLFYNKEYFWLKFRNSIVESVIFSTERFSNSLNNKGHSVKQK